MSNWINVKDKLPNKNIKRVLRYDINMNEGQQNMAYQIFDADMLKYCSEETFWMPLPEPPKGDNCE